MEEEHPKEPSHNNPEEAANYVKAIDNLLKKKTKELCTSSFNNAIKLVNENVQITHDQLITLENRTSIMAKAIIPVLKDFKQQWVHYKEYTDNTSDIIGGSRGGAPLAHAPPNRIQFFHFCILFF